MSRRERARTAGVDRGPTWRRLTLGPLSTRVHLRTVTVCVVTLALAVAIALMALVLGTANLPLGDVLATLVGRSDPVTHTIVVEWRAPRAVAALMFGAALGLSGAIFQSLTRNPLASPDIIGFSSGSYTGALVVIILAHGTYLQTAAGALVAGLITAFLVYLLAYRNGVQGFRLIVVGIAVSAILSSLNTWMTLTADLQVAMTASAWGAGSLAASSWPQQAIAAIVIALLLAVMLVLSRPLHQLELGDDAAKASGVRSEPARLLLLVTGVALIAVVTASAGPIAFVALAAPQIARRLTRSAGTTLSGAACLGALLLVAADIAAQHMLPVAMPVGVVTVVVGGSYLVWLLIREVRRRA